MGLSTFGSIEVLAIKPVSIETGAVELCEKREYKHLVEFPAKASECFQHDSPMAAIELVFS